MAPRRPTLATAQAAAASAPESFKRFDQYVEEAGLPPFLLPVSEDETLVIECPTGHAMRLLDRAVRTDSLELMAEAAFGEQSERIWELAGPKAFPVVRAILRDVLDHFQIALVSVPESPASSR